MEFERMMAMEGVRPLGAKPSQTPRRPAAAPAPHDAAPRAIADPAPPRAAWVTGPAARRALDVALERCREEASATFGSAMLQDGSTRPLPTRNGAARLLVDADRLDARLIVIGGEGWTFVMHPAMGIATLDRSPVD